ncbi:hypothetical protein ACFW5I_07935 [Streptomyces sp. NPDC058818]|uniref:hypothetical protein n=1 Tax=Streptomyces sp. NPDC058818 TaxID=3346640 RepID=UPI0036AE68DF
MTAETAEFERLRTQDAVHVWRGRAPDALLPEDTALLSAAELGIVRRRLPQAAVRYAGAHAVLRRVLARYLGEPPEGCPLRGGSTWWTHGAPAALPFSHEWSVDCGISR